MKIFLLEDDFALNKIIKEPLPNKFIKDIIKVDYDRWIKQKDLKF
jgi:hypothetical protein